ncbi:NAD(P)-dependent alcohol dehydrogenase [Mucilaginibacter phyllosphaerae]|uniref:NAD(P)-dependent alcohol dehydrogenase n=1 Tax=Mucilaginibacter phyllosphaerae TaxID=1812349 RepID=A0A4Y8A7V2_9SPHI|nr:NAD(P)-dependent alcohol dehydrogenase [Mucilaginibacter phyllosphaerae]MBB3970493.1 putative zinc-type alcohol dehydrogenase-like protein [Mucilaginibacter phyllosphaerae]TEW64509.1 NAD(P)-dependent alcohol dehydrogenase [Mucilaginibacter phyllosphaerae]GGH19132.1 NADP-dependent alcohol dehydrogenase [Mucilaginibacter phyllosphaerae]
MIQVKGYAAQNPQTDLAPWDFERREVGPHDVQFEILFCGVCHSDLHQIKNDWFPGIFPMVPGHEIVGRVTKVGNHVKNFKVGDLAGTGCMVDSCQVCENCKQDLEQYCMEGSTQTYNSMERDGSSPTYGGYSNSIVVREEFVLHISEKLDLAATAPLLCAGITTYSPLRHWKVGKGHKLAVLGLGGLGHMAVKFGVAFGAEVTVLSTSPKKEADAKKLGAHHFVVTSDPEQIKAAAGTFDFILDTVSAEHDFNMYLGLLRTNGTMICVGVPPKPAEIAAFSLLAGRKSLAGSGIGGIAETQEMLDFCAEHNIVSDIEMINIKDITTAYERMQKGDVRYRFVIDIATL